MNLDQHDGRRITAEEAGRLQTAYLDLLQPFRQLGALGLARFYAHLPYPWEWEEETRERRSDEPGWAAKEARALKECAERYVMGDLYSSLYANGREEPMPTDWGDWGDWAPYNTWPEG
jgi:hypothetical protein